MSFKSAGRQGEREDDGHTDDHDGEASLPSLLQSPYSSVFNVRWSKKRPACVVKSARRQDEREDDGRTDDHDDEASLPSLSQSPYSSVFNVRWSKKRPACAV